MIAISFVGFLLLFLIIGVSSVLKRRKTSEDYLAASKSVPPWLAGLSAVATNNSGYMFIGMIGVTYKIGLSSIWLMFGWIIGDLMSSLLTVSKIRQVSNNPKIHSFGGLLAHWHNTDYRMLRRLSGLFTVFFMTIYAAAQLKAGGKAMAELIHWQANFSIIMGALIVLIYSVVGGIRASIWTDAAQSVVMLAGMALLAIVGLETLGGIDSAIQKLSSVQVGYMNWFPNKSGLEIILFITGWLFGGIAVIGQPHIVIRFICLDKPENVNRMRVYYYTWFTLFYGATIIAGLLTRAIFPEVAQFDAELALLKTASYLFPTILIGLVLAALFAATLSTTDSLVLSCSAAITRDFIQAEHHSLWAAKLSTFIVLLVATFIALYGDQSVFKLVLDAWGLLASAFVPLILVYAMGYKCPEKLGIAMMMVGVMGFLFWQNMGLGKLIYSVAPGIMAGLLCFMLGYFLRATALKYSLK